MLYVCNMYVHNMYVQCLIYSSGSTMSVLPQFSAKRVYIIYKV